MSELEQQIEKRRAKRRRMEEAGVEVFPSTVEYDFEPAGAHERYGQRDNRWTEQKQHHVTAFCVGTVRNATDREDRNNRNDRYQHRIQQNCSGTLIQFLGQGIGHQCQADAEQGHLYKLIHVRPPRLAQASQRVCRRPP